MIGVHDVQLYALLQVTHSGKQAKHEDDTPLS
jgi:hypothetical protein